MRERSIDTPLAATFIASIELSERDCDVVVEVLRLRVRKIGGRCAQDDTFHEVMKLMR